MIEVVVNREDTPFVRSVYLSLILIVVSSPLVLAEISSGGLGQDLSLDPDMGTGISGSSGDLELDDFEDQDGLVEEGEDVKVKVGKLKLYKRGATWNDFVDENGTHVFESYPGSINYLVGGEYEPIDTTIRPNGKGFNVEKGHYKARWDDKAVLRLEKDGYFLEYQEKGLRLRGFEKGPRAQPWEREARDNKLKYRGVYDNIDSEFIYKHDMLKHNYIIREPLASGGRSGTLEFEGVLEYSSDFVVHANGVIPEADFETQGAIDFFVGGERFVSIAPPIIVDSNDEFVLGTYKVKRRGKKMWLTLEVPLEWLQSSERAYPVTVDPSYYWRDPVDDTYAVQWSPNWVPFSGRDNWLVVRREGGGNQRAYMKFNLPTWMEKYQIEDVDVRVVKWFASKYDRINLYKSHSNWYETSLTWNNKPSVGSYLARIDTGSRDYEYKTFSSWSITTYVRNEISSGKSQISYQMKFPTEDSPWGAAYFYSSDNSAYYYWPKMIIYYNMKPSVSLSSPPNGAVLTDTTPSFSWDGSDPDGDQLTYKLYIDDDSDPFSGYISRFDVATAKSYTLSNSEALSDGKYYWGVRVTDMWDSVKSGVRSFTINAPDNVKPEFKEYDVSGCNYKDTSNKVCWVNSGTTTYHYVRHYDGQSTPKTQYLTFTRDGCTPNGCSSGNEIKSHVDVDTGSFDDWMTKDSYLDITGAACVESGGCTGKYAKEKWTVKTGSYGRNFKVWTYFFNSNRANFYCLTCI